MRHVRWFLVILPTLFGCGVTSVGDSSESCVGPYLDNQPPSGRYGTPAPTVRPGDTLTIYGHWYTSTCNDTGVFSCWPPLAFLDY